MKILLSGATGFLGSYLLKAFIKEKYEVIVIKRSHSNVWRIINEIDSVKSYDIDKTDIGDIFKNNTIDIVVHTAISHSRNSENFLETFKTNVLFPLTLLDFARKNNVKTFINTGTTLPVTPEKITHDYVLSKTQFLQWAKSYSDKINIVNIIFDYIYGPFENKIKFLPFIVDNCMKNIPSIDLSECRQKRDFIYIDDIVSAYMKIINTKISGYKEYEVGYGNTLSLKDVAETIKFMTASHTELNFGAIPYRVGEPKEIKTNPTEINSLGWMPKISLKEGIKRIIDEEYKK